MTLWDIWQLVALWLMISISLGFLVGACIEWGMRDEKDH